MSAYTKGPWLLLTIPAGAFGSAKSFVAAATHKGHPYFGHTRYFDIIGEEDYPAKEADQKLIACAPDMVDLLLKVRDSYAGSAKLEIQALLDKAGVTE